MANKWHCYLLKLKNTNYQNIKKKTVPLFLFPEGQKCIKIISTVFILMLQYFWNNIKMKLNILVTKYTDTFIFIFAHVINTRWSIMPL